MSQTSIHRAGFEPAPPKRVGLKSTTLDHSVNDVLLIRDLVFPDSHIVSPISPPVYPDCHLSFQIVR